MPPSHFCMIHFNINHPPKSRSSNWSLSLRCPYHNPVCNCPLPNACHMPHQSHLPWCDQPSNIWWAIQTTTLLIKQFPLRQPFDDVLPTSHKRGAQFVTTEDGYIKTFFVLGPCWRFLQESWRTAWGLWRNACLKIQCIRERVRCRCVVL
jgi:hypothetical protein